MLCRSVGGLATFLRFRFADFRPRHYRKPDNLEKLRQRQRDSGIDHPIHIIRSEDVESAKTASINCLNRVSCRMFPLGPRASGSPTMEFDSHTAPYTSATADSPVPYVLPRFRNHSACIR